MLSKVVSSLPRQSTVMLMIAALVYKISGGLATLSGLAFPTTAWRRRINKSKEYHRTTAIATRHSPLATTPCNRWTQGVSCWRL